MGTDIRDQQIHLYAILNTVSTVHHADVVEPLRVVVLVYRELLVVKVLETVSLYLSHTVLAQYPDDDLICPLCFTLCVTVGHCGWRGSRRGLLCMEHSVSAMLCWCWLTLSVVVTVAVMVTPGGRYGVTWRPSAGGNTAMRRLSYITDDPVPVRKIKDRYCSEAPKTLRLSPQNGV